MKILLTGATGFIGGAFRALALRQGHDVAALVRPGPGLQPRLPAHPRQLELPGTLADAPWDRIRAWQPEVCVHAAWITTPGKYLEAPENHRWADESLAFLQHTVAAGVRHWVCLGTCIEYAPSPGPLSETHSPLAPATTYARCKNELRLALAAEAARDGLTLAWGRVFYPYGPGEHPARLCSALLHQLRAGERVELKTPDSVKDYIFIEDLAAAVMTVTEARYHGAINLGTGVGTTVRQVAKTAAGLLGRGELVTCAEPPSVDPLGDIVADATPLRALGWQPQVRLEAGITRMLNQAPHE